MPSTYLDRHHAVPGCGRVRLRLPRTSDRAEITGFLARMGVSTGDLDVRRGLRFQRGGRWSVVATRWNGARDEIVGVATVDTTDGAPTLMADEPAVAALLA
ncbi:MAG TPA: hypothetical protein VN238_18455, partial [Solirubrobacteraceae bacterium]|nr:hypothetical protein [Solirubrobacteraceae bacterium]